ncbi:Tim44 domain-containing protein [Pusillimonas sp.]|uniref:Tim44 domain-containing protein n=1 Tax=Pusillimonas sp. TaxID=3040095 RepID=UPI0037CB381A
MNKRFSRFMAMALIAISAVGMVAVSFDAEARRFGGGKSFGKQSSRVTQNQPAAAAPPAATTTQRSASSAAAPGAAAAGTAARSGMSRFLGPLAGIAAGLGIAALLSHLGLGGAFLEMMSSLILIGLVIFAIMFIVRRLRGPRAAHQSAGGMRREGMGASEWSRPASAPAAAPAPMPAAEPAPVAQQPQEGWFIPQGFDTAAFLANAKQQFIAIQGIWDSGDVDQLGEYLTDDLIAEFRPQVQAREGRPEHTEVVLLNAELLGIEPVAGGHLASVRYSGMLREAPGAEAFRFEEVWNLYKADNAGWLLAGIQQIPGQQAN